MTGVFTKNWDGMKNSMVLGGVSRNGESTVRDISGSLVRAVNCVSPLRSVASSFQPNSSNNSIWFGSSDAAALNTDITLGSVYSSGVTYVASTNSEISWNGDTASRTFSVIIQNTATDSKTIREFGIVSASSGNAVLLYHGVLDTPVTISQYESAGLTLTVSMTLSDPV